MLLLTFIGPTAVWRHSDIGSGRARLPKPWTENAKIMWENQQRHGIVWEADGVEAGVAIAVESGFSFMVNGKCDGNAIHDASTQMGLGILPAALHPDPKTCFVVGLGTGETAGWLGKIPSVQRVDAVEIEPALDEMVRRCASVNGDVFHNPKIHVIYNDAREVLLTNRQTYDIIASEPSNPYRAGIANLFTREFYEAVGGRLNEGGLFIQWLQAYETDETTVFTVFATLKSVFKHVEIWQSKHDDMLLLCSNQPFSYTAEGLRRRIAEEPYRTALAVAWRATQMEGFLARYVAGERLVEEASRNYARCLNTDDHNRVEYGFARTLGRPERLLRGEASPAGHRAAIGSAGVPVRGRGLGRRRRREDRDVGACATGSRCPRCEREPGGADQGMDAIPGGRLFGHDLAVGISTPPGPLPHGDRSAGAGLCHEGTRSRRNRWRSNCGATIHESRR